VIEETIEQVLADRMGFDTVWFVEHPRQLDVAVPGGHLWRAEPPDQRIRLASAW
jgi:alkanesulfonate monooxygenase SsuD/methylene tetrahydromethanopterin reductase-like flavin-dependent oxidoreductase (luciferase family)